MKVSIPISDSNLSGPSVQPARTCATCGSPISGKFCSGCGELEASTRRYDLRHFVVETVEHFTHADHNVFRSLRLLLFKPGFLTSEFMAGRRKKYLGPAQLFLMTNLVFFFLQSFYATGPFTVPLELQLKASPYMGLLQRTVDRTLAETHIEPQELEREFDHRQQSAAKEFLILMVPVFAGILAVMEIPRKLYFVEHLVFSLHYYTFLMLVAFLLLPTLQLATMIFRPTEPREGPAIYVTITVLVALYLYFAVRRVYRNGPWLAAPLALVLTAATMLVVVLYRFFLFFEVLHSIRT